MLKAPARITSTYFCISGRKVLAPEQAVGVGASAELAFSVGGRLWGCRSPIVEDSAPRDGVVAAPSLMDNGKQIPFLP